MELMAKVTVCRCRHVAISLGVHNAGETLTGRVLICLLLHTQWRKRRLLVITVGSHKTGGEPKGVPIQGNGEVAELVV
jgi:hypothetical protein